MNAGYIVAKANATAVPFVAKAENERPEWIVLSRHAYYGDACEAILRPLRDACARARKGGNQ